MPVLLQRCPLCNSAKIREMFAARDPHYGIPGSHQLSLCEECSIVFLNPMYSDEELAAMYPADYYAYQDEIAAGRWKASAKKLLGYWQGITDPTFDAPGTVLDVGCGAGAFLISMREKGWEVRGVEINASAAQRAMAKGLNVFCGSLPEAGLQTESFDYIRASHSFEHMTQPHMILNEAYRLLKPEGKLLLAVPNYGSLPARVFRQYWYHLCAPVHAFQYSVAGLTHLLTQHDFKVTRVVFNSHYAGILGSAQIWLNRQTAKRSFEGWVFNSRVLRVVSGWMENGADILRLGDMIEITAAKARKT